MPVPTSLEVQLSFGIGGRFVGTLHELEGRPPDAFHVPPEYIPTRLLARYATDVRKSHRLKDLKQILQQLTESNLSHLVYLTPIDIEQIRQALAPDQYSAVLENLNLLRHTLVESGARWLNLSESVTHEEFSDLYFPTEYLRLGGRFFVANKITDAIRAEVQKADGRNVLAADVGGGGRK